MAIEALTNPASVYNDVQTPTQNTQKRVMEAEESSEKMENVSGSKVDDTSSSKTAEEKDIYEVENAKDVSAEKVKKAIAEINQKIRPTRTSCQFSYHEETNRISIKVINDDTDEVIREIPPEKTLDMIAKTLELEGMLVDEKR